jgi:hypothetical protein
MSRESKQAWILAGVLAVALFATNSPIFAQEAAADDAGWKYTLNVYGWGTGFTGELGPNSHQVDVHSSISDVLEVLDFAAFLHFEAHKGRWGIMVDPIYANLGTTADSQGRRLERTVDLDMEASVFILAGSYQVYKGPQSTLDFTFGGRYMGLTADIAPRHVPAYHEKVSWVDPVIGLKGSVRMSKAWTFVYRGDIGGFGVGSDLTWLGALVFDAQVSKVVSINFGFNALYNDYKQGSGPNDFTFDATFMGPFLGVGFKW